MIEPTFSGSVGTRKNPGPFLSLTGTVRFPLQTAFAGFSLGQICDPHDIERLILTLYTGVFIAKISELTARADRIESKQGGRMRSGPRGLELLAVPLNVHILEALAEEEQPLNELSRAVGHPPASTMRSYLKALVDLTVVERIQEPGFPGSVTYRLTAEGERFLDVAGALRYWLSLAPDGPIAIGSRAAKSATKALVDGWSSGIVRALASRPLTLTDLNRLIPQITYPTLERRLAAMRAVGQAEVRRNGSGRGTPYVASTWLRQAVAPLTTSIGWEQRCTNGSRPAIHRIDMEAVLLLAVPLLELRSDCSGVCRLTVESRRGADIDYTGVRVTVEEGRSSSCTTRLGGVADASVSGSAADWWLWLSGEDPQAIEFVGDPDLGFALASGLRSLVLGTAGEVGARS